MRNAPNSKFSAEAKMAEGGDDCLSKQIIDDLPKFFEGRRFDSTQHDGSTQFINDQAATQAGTIFPNIAFGQINLSKSPSDDFMVRTCYKELEDIICSRIGACNQSIKYAKCCIAGTPGIGKSTMLCYILARLPFIADRYNIKGALIYAEKKTASGNQKEANKVKYCRTLYKWKTAGNPPRPTGYTTYTIYRLDESEMSLEECENLKEARYITLIDGSSHLPDFKESMGHTIIFTSPSIKAFRRREELGVDFYYMPTWTQAEFDLLLANKPTLQNKTGQRKKGNAVCVQRSWWHSRQHFCG